MTPDCHFENMQNIIKILFNIYLNNYPIITECVYGHNTCLVKDTSVQPI